MAWGSEVKKEVQIMNGIGGFWTNLLLRKGDLSMKNIRYYFIKVLVLCLVFIVCLVDYAKAASPALKYKGTMTIHVIQSLTGASGAISTLYFQGFEALRRYTNEELGGINGWKVEYKWADDGSTVPRALTIYKNFRQDKPLLVILPTSLGGEALKPQLAADKIPGWNVFPSGGQIFPLTSVYIFGVPYEEQTAAFIKYVVKQRSPQRPKIALITHEVGWGKAMVDTLENLAPKMGADFSDHEFVGFGTVDMSTVMKRFEAKGVTDLYVATYSASTGVPVTNWHDLGLKGKMTLTIISVDPPDLTIVLAKEKAEGVRFWSQFRLPSEAKTDPNIKKVIDFWNTIHAMPIADASFGGWMAMEVVYEAIRLALKTVNNNATKLTGVLVAKAFDSVKDFKGTLHPKVTLGPGVRSTFNGFRMVEVQKDPATGKLAGVPITDWVEVGMLPRVQGQANVDFRVYKP